MLQNFTRYFRLLLFVQAIILFSTGCRKSDLVPVTQPDAANVSANVAVDWMEATRRLVKIEGKNPPQASRIYAYAAIAVYESAVPGMNRYQSLEHQVAGLVNLPNPADFTELDYTVAVNEAMYQLLLKLTGTLKQENVSEIEGLHSRYYNEKIRTIPIEKLRNAADFGKMVASAILKRVSTDNFAESRSMNYDVPNWSGNTGFWAPTDAANTKPLEPFWGKVKCFAMKSSNECEIASTIPFSTTATSLFFQQANEVLAISKKLSAEEKKIASWWADGGGTSTPPGHWVAIENQLVKDLNLSLGKAAEMYALVNIGMADAFISCWDAKYKYNLLRPQTYIQNYITGNNSWKPYIPTPPFPEYPSGHSVSSGVAAELLTQLFGTLSFTDQTNTGSGLSPRAFNSFKDAAHEAALSRLYGGIHYREACEKGLEQGALVAQSLSKNIKLKK
jgi:hypothetical protein